MGYSGGHGTERGMQVLAGDGNGYLVHGTEQFLLETDSSYVLFVIASLLAASNVC